MALKPVSKGLPWAWAASVTEMRTLSTISADFAKVEEIANRMGKGSLIRAKCGMRASSSDSSEPLLLVHRSARERRCLMTSRSHVIPHAHKLESEAHLLYRRHLSRGTQGRFSVKETTKCHGVNNFV